MALQGIDRLVFALEFRLREERMDLAMTDPVKPDRLHAPPRTRQKMVGVALRDRYGALTQRANRLRIAGGCGETGIGLGDLALDSACHDSVDLLALERALTNGLDPSITNR